MIDQVENEKSVLLLACRLSDPYIFDKHRRARQYDVNSCSNLGIDNEPARFTFNLPCFTS